MTTPLAEQPTALGLRHSAAHLDDLVATATKKRLGPLETIEMLVEREGQHRAKRSLERRLSRSRIGRFKPMADYEGTGPSASTACHRGGNPPRVPRTRPQHRPDCTAGAGQDDDYPEHRPSSCARRSLGPVHHRCPAPPRPRGARLRARSNGDSATTAGRSLLCLDEIGYLSYDARNADLLFQIVSRRYENKSLVMTTNLAVSDWPTIFPSATCATALIDRTVHHAEVIAIEGDSYRRREAEADKKTRRAKKTA